MMAMMMMRAKSTSVAASELGANRMMRTESRSMRCSVKSARVPPWLMLPPVFEGGDMFYNFYTLDDQVKSFRKIRDGVDLDQLPPDGARFVGSSHGWLALFDEISTHVFLSNPISGRNIKLPPISTPAASEYRVILSCSPDDEEEECRAMMTLSSTYTQERAFCVPGVSTEWTLFGEQRYEDFVYCIRRKAFSCITPTKLEFSVNRVRVGVRSPRHPNYQIDDWNVEDPLSPVMADMMWFFVFQGPPHSWKENEKNVELFLRTEHCFQRLHLVCVEQSDVVVQGRCNAFCFYDTFETVGFVVVKIDEGCITVVENLNGLAIFVGMNHSFAIPEADDFSGMLKPNSIYFTDASKYFPPSKYLYGNESGIFDYDKKTFSPSSPRYYNYAFPIWFTPDPISRWPGVSPQARKTC